MTLPLRPIDVEFWERSIVEEPRCEIGAFPHDDGYDEQCGKCRGAGGWIDDVEAEIYDPTSQPYDEPFRHVCNGTKK